VVGASGYVGQRLVDRLSRNGRRVVALGRTVDRLPTGPGVDRRQVDVGDPDQTASALDGVDAAYYLVHAMAGGEGYAERDRATAQSFAAAARSVGLGRIVYLGGLGEEGLSEHLSSRQEVGEILRESGVAVVELRAAVILGAGSISFEMLRYLTERLPAMVCPRWVETRLQPLAERDLLAYLEKALEVPPGIYEIGSSEVTTYHAMMQSYAKVRGLRRRAIVKVPLLTPSLSARWVDLVTPVDRSVSHALIESLTNEVTVKDERTTAEAFGIEPMPVTEALRSALADQAERMPERLFDLVEGQADGIYAMRSDVTVPADRVAALRADLAEGGGDLRWYGATWPWRLRIVLGRLFGEELRVQRPERFHRGSTLDWWVIERTDRDSVVLGTTKWFFGEAWLGYRVLESRATTPGRGESSPAARVEQVAAFRPKGVSGFLYWRFLRPVHRRVFRSMVGHRVQRAMPDNATGSQLR
jgi:uncharacterized protein YbjT (DUF2867 family)